MTAELFDMHLRALRRDRAFIQGPELFLYERAFQDCLDRIAIIHRQFRSALLVGCPDPRWRDQLQTLVESVRVVDPGRLFADTANGTNIVEDEWSPPSQAFDLVIAIGTLDSVNDLSRALQSFRFSLREDSLLIGALAGGESLPRLRTAMHMADQLMGASSPHMHPRIEPSSLAPLLNACGFIMPVVDIDRVKVSYGSLDKLVSDLRRMGATNILKSRSRKPLSRSAKAAAAAAFESGGLKSQTVEVFDIVHFASWTPTADALNKAEATLTT